MAVLYVLVGIIAAPFYALWQIALALGEALNVAEAVEFMHDLGKKVLRR